MGQELRQSSARGFFAPCGFDGCHLVVFGWQMGWSAGSRKAVLTSFVLRQGSPKVWSPLELLTGVPVCFLFPMAVPAWLDFSHGALEFPERVSKRPGWELQGFSWPRLSVTSVSFYWSKKSLSRSVFKGRRGRDFTSMEKGHNAYRGKKLMVTSYHR